MESEKQTYKNGFVISYCPTHIQAKYVSGKEFIMEFGHNVWDILMRGGDKKVYYNDVGITIDYWINNLLAKKRRCYANELLLSDVPTPTIYRKGEAFSFKIISEMMSK